MKVLKRNGSHEPMKFDKITSRMRRFMKGLSEKVVADKVAQQVFAGLYDGISSKEINTLAAEVAIGMVTDDPDYEKLATKIVINTLHKNCPDTFFNAMTILHNEGILASDVMKSIEENQNVIEAAIKQRRDYEFGYFGLKTLEKSYLQTYKGKIIETPQYMYMRVSVGIYPNDIASAIKTYNDMSTGLYTHATPTLFNAGTQKPQMSSCFLVGMKEDSISGIYDTIKTCAQISKWAGGIGLWAHNIRSRGSHIRGTNGTSDGIIPMLRVLNATARYVNQAGRRKGSIAIYMEPWHADIMEFLELRLNQGDEEMRCRDLFTALWIPDLFMKRVQEGGKWSLFCPDDTKDLVEFYGEEFEKRYEQYEKEGKATVTVDAKDVWLAILKSQVETGTPYMVYKDAANKKSNQKNLGTIKSSNLCVEIIEYSSPDEVAVCNLASISLPKMIQGGTFNFNTLHNVAQQLTRNLNAVIDRNFYPIEEAKRSNMKHRPIGIGVQGLADVFLILGCAFDSDEAKKLNREIFETIYHGALVASNTMAKELGKTYESYEGSPTSQGLLQYDLWGEKPTSMKWNWDLLKENIKSDGLYNSLLVAPMPTASTSQILGNNECIEPYTSNIYLRRTLAGEYVVVNKHLVKDLQSLGLWTPTMKNNIIRENGSVQNISEISNEMKAKYKTVWEISQKTIIDMARDRAPFVCQSQSMNLFIENPTTSKLSSMHMYSLETRVENGNVLS